MIFDESIAFKQSKYFLMDSDYEELPVFEEEVVGRKKNQIMKMKVPINIYNLW